MKPSIASSAVVAAFLLMMAQPARTHCDALDGPVVTDARVALDSKDVTPVLKWVYPDKEGEIREAFQGAVAVRALGPDARTLADRFFFETLVCLHGEGDGRPFSGRRERTNPGTRTALFCRWFTGPQSQESPR
jgi:Family of unknown function (DUF6448)